MKIAQTRYYAAALIAALALTTAPLPASAGLMDWLGFWSRKTPDVEPPAEAPSEPTFSAAEYKTLTDPNKGAVRVNIRMVMADGGDATGHGFCDFRKTQRPKCQASMQVKPDFLPKAGSGYPVKFIDFDFTRWAQAEDRITIQFKWNQNLDVPFYTSPPHRYQPERFAGRRGRLRSDFKPFGIHRYPSTKTKIRARLL